MAKIKVGDKVKMLHDTMEGLIQSIDNGIITIETSEGFMIPVMEAEVVLIELGESSKLVSKPTPKESPKTEANIKGFFIAAIVDARFQIKLFLVNNECSEKYVILSRVLSKTQSENYWCTKVSAGSFEKIPGSFTIEDTTLWTKWHIQAVSFENGKTAQPVLEQIITLKSKKVLLADTKIPLVEQNGYFKNLVDSKVQFTEKHLFTEVKKPSLESLELIDLHAEALGLLPELVNLMDLQLDAFEKHFDQCVMYGIEKCTVIHGTGKGVLKDRIHHFLSQNNNVKLFKESRKDKFGYGATDIQFK